MHSRSLIKKLAISVTTNIEPETNFIAGFPTTPRQAISRGQSRAVARPEILTSPRRTPKTMSLNTEGSVPLAIAEGAREQVDQLSRKFGADQAFIRGFLFELEKEAGPLDWVRARLRPKAKILSMRVHEKPIAMSQSIKPSIEPGAEFARMDPTIKKLEARRAAGRRQP